MTKPTTPDGRNLRFFSAPTTLLGAAACLLAAQPAFADSGDDRGDDDSSIGTVIVIAMENHNFTQPNPTANPQQILGNAAAPYINSLITPGNPNATQVSYALAYHNAGHGVHPSEPNYVWAEAGTDFGVHTDADPSAASHNIFDAEHLTSQLDAANIAWKNYQEDVQLSTSPTASASGSNGPVNPYYGTTQFNYAVKHNPMAFFSDTATLNVYPLSKFFQDLNDGTLGKYNWITPNQFNDAHSALSGGFTYKGTHFTGDQASIAQGDSFLAQVIPQITASNAYKQNGVIVIWWDESEGGDGLDRTVPEIIISPLAKGNAYASHVELNHSSDLKTMAEIFRLPFVTNAIPSSETSASGSGLNNVASVNDLSDLFVPGAIPGPRSFEVTREDAHSNPKTHEVSQVLHVANSGREPVPAPIFVVLDNLPSGVALLDQQGVTTNLAPTGSPYVVLDIGGDDLLRPHETKTVKLRFSNPSDVTVTYDTRVLSVTPAP